MKHLSKTFGNNAVLRDIDLDIETGEFLTIFGPNGAGKTTLVKIMSTLISPTAGTVLIEDYDVKKSPLEVRQLIGIISHETYLYQDLTARENLKFFGNMYGMPKDMLDSRIHELTDQVGLKYRLDDRVGTFSRGMKQRLSIARAILHDPKILFLDEPYTGLDQHAAATFDRILSELDVSDKTQVMVSHDIERGLNLADRIIILYEGKIVYQAARSEIKDIEQFREIYEYYVHEV
ncbi:MAG TPA: ABC transporter ATP-binding protein [Candidatus Nanoarchaeia archaeon]|nr:ABC transporter ATP-binding protein [Candidatus Nanoarchaeia archaeon]